MGSALGEVNHTRGAGVGVGSVRGELAVFVLYYKCGSDVLH